MDFNDHESAVLIAADLVAEGEPGDDLLALASLNPYTAGHTSWRELARGVLRRRRDVEISERLGIRSSSSSVGDSSHGEGGWEYLTLRSVNDGIAANGVRLPSNITSDEEALDVFGREGWELVSVLTEGSEIVRPSSGEATSRPLGWRFVMKRRR
ncbi:MAG TPA: hypothetical protein VK988_02245 [Acidimicrobiales bacterium]|nr:hypothetical protein [Acidimicrobiales bacterium]